MISISRKANGDMQAVFSVTSVERTLTQLLPDAESLHSEGTIRRNSGYTMRRDAQILSTAQSAVIGNGAAIVFAGGKLHD
jgi:hypothetical protein